jgi:hypothetical protein
LEQVCVKISNSQFLKCNDSFGRWGRVDYAGQNSQQKCNDPDSAIRMFEQKFYEKVRLRDQRMSAKKVVVLISGSDFEPMERSPRLCKERQEILLA